MGGKKCPDGYNMEILKCKVLMMRLVVVSVFTSYVCQDNYTNQVHPYHENMIAYMDHVKQQLGL